MGVPFKKPSTTDSGGVDVERLYRNRFDEASREAKARIWKVVVEQFFQRWVGEIDTVLDIGCGYGEFLNHLDCSRRIGLDCNSDAKNFLAAGIEFHQRPASDLSFLDDGSVDVVFTSNLLEHLRDKAEVEQTLREAHRVLRSGGHVIAMGPNIRVLGGSYWDFWDHHVAITDRSLDELLRYVGYDVVDNIPRFLPYTTRSRLPQSPFLVSLYLKVPLVWRVLGGQFLLRARKP